MGAKRSEEMRHAIRLVEDGDFLYEAANKAGVYASSLSARRKKDGLPPLKRGRKPRVVK